MIKLYKYILGRQHRSRLVGWQESYRCRTWYSLRALTKYIENISDEDIMDDIDVSKEKRALTARARFFA